MRRRRRDRSLDLSAPVVGNGSPSPSPSMSTCYPRRRSSPRMASFDYVGGHRYHVVVNTERRTSIFDDSRWARRAVEALVVAARATQFEIDAYCVMPDHVHFLAVGDAGEKSDLGSLVHRFKQALGFEFKRATGRSLWQRSYYEHVLRRDEPSLPYLAYILGNPIQAGFVDHADQWPHAGPPGALAELGADRSEDLSLQLTAIAAAIESDLAKHQASRTSSRRTLATSPGPPASAGDP